MWQAFTARQLHGPLRLTTRRLTVALALAGAVDDPRFTPHVGPRVGRERRPFRPEAPDAASATRVVWRSVISPSGVEHREPTRSDQGTGPPPSAGRVDRGAFGVLRLLACLLRARVVEHWSLPAVDGQAGSDAEPPLLVGHFRSRRPDPAAALDAVRHLREAPHARLLIRTTLASSRVAIPLPRGRPLTTPGAELILLDRRASFGIEDARLLHAVLPALSARLALPLLAGRDRPTRATPAVEISVRHRATLQLLLRGLSEKQVAQQLGISRHTVHDHVKAIYRAYAVTSRGELTAKLLLDDDALAPPDR